MKRWIHASSQHSYDYATIRNASVKANKIKLNIINYFELFSPFRYPTLDKINKFLDQLENSDKLAHEILSHFSPKVIDNKLTYSQDESSNMIILTFAAASKSSIEVDSSGLLFYSLSWNEYSKKVEEYTSRKMKLDSLYINPDDYSFSGSWTSKIPDEIKRKLRSSLSRKLSPVGLVVQKLSIRDSKYSFNICPKEYNDFVLNSRGNYIEPIQLVFDATNEVYTDIDSTLYNQSSPVVYVFAPSYYVDLGSGKIEFNSDLLSSIREATETWKSTYRKKLPKEG